MVRLDCQPQDIQNVHEKSKFIITMFSNFGLNTAECYDNHILLTMDNVWIILLEFML